MNITKRKGRAIGVILVTAMILCAAGSLPVYSADEQFRLPVEQIFTTQSERAESVFSYKLTAEQPGSPMPVDVRGEEYPFTIEGDDVRYIGPFNFVRPGVFKYELRQVVDEKKPGYIYDDTQYTVEIWVNTKLQVVTAVYDRNGEKVAAVSFENRYEVKATDPRLMTDPPVKKTVTGSPREDAIFHFRLQARDASQPMPEGSVNGVKTIEIRGSGEAEFGVWSYDREGTYIYTVTEVNTKLPGYTYDTAVYTITDEVRDEDGQLALYRTVSGDKGGYVTELAYVNHYAAKGGGPLTGDNSGMILYLLLLALSAMAVVGIPVYLIATGKRRQEK